MLTRLVDPGSPQTPRAIDDSLRPSDSAFGPGGMIDESTSIPLVCSFASFGLVILIIWIVYLSMA